MSPSGDWNAKKRTKWERNVTEDDANPLTWVSKSHQTGREVSEEINKKGG